MAAIDADRLLAAARTGVNDYLQNAQAKGLIDSQQFRDASAKTFPNLEEWLRDPHIDRISPQCKRGIAMAIESGHWEALVNAFRQRLSFGTGGIRGMMAFDRDSIVRLKEDGLDAPILKGPNTLNNVLLLRTSAGVAQFGNSRGLTKMLIGYDSRVRGKDFAQAIAELFLAYGYTVYLADEPCPYPEVTFAIPHLKSDIGVLISASHNDYRYNGYKLSSANGSQFDPKERDDMYKNFILKASFADVKRCPLKDAPKGKLVFFGGAEKVKSVEYFEAELVNVHDRLRDHILGQLVDRKALEERNRSPKSIQIGYCAFHGAGRLAMPRLFKEGGFAKVKLIEEGGLYDLNGLFPSFCSDPGKEQQPDPGDPRAAKIAVDAFKKQYPGEFEKTDVIIGTDPDADRCGVIVKVPPAQRHLYDGNDYMLLPADDMWALIVWFRLQSEVEKHGKVLDADKKFIAQSTVTSDSIVKVARKFGLGVVKTWVGFANLAAGVKMIWDKQTLPSLSEGRLSPQEPLCHPFVWEFEAMDNGQRSFNSAAMEQSNGFSILGGAPKDARSLGAGGHVRDKDGTFAAMLCAEIAAYAKDKGTSLFQLVDKKIYLDPAVGLFVNRYEPDPLDGEYPGIQGDRKKKAILRRALAVFHLAKAGGLKIGPLTVHDAALYRTGKYDHVYTPTYDFQFPDEGIRFYFDAERLNWAIVRPSGTGNALRLHVQLHTPVTEQNLIAKKGELMRAATEVMDLLRDRLGAPRE
jgi:phosphoglucomutase